MYMEHDMRREVIKEWGGGGGGQEEGVDRK